MGGALAASTGSSNVALGDGAGKNVTTSGSVCIGPADSFIPGFADLACGEGGVGENSVNIGASCMSEALPAAQGPFSVAIGAGCGLSGVGQASVCLGAFSGASGVCGARAILIGDNAGGAIGASGPVGEDSVCISTAAQCSGARSVVVGPGANGSGAECVAIGNAASAFEHGVAIGNQANANAGAIMINATNVATTSASSDSFCVRPVRVTDPASTSSQNHIRLPLTTTGFTQVLLYNPATFEIQACALDAVV